MLYAITDIETTGSYASGNSITEVAVILTDGIQEVDRWTSLIQPRHAIPNYITALTGINNSMTEVAPRFEDIATELHDILSDVVFVAHNVHFDYSFLRLHFEMCGLYWSPRKLCTVRLSRKIFPGLPSYSLGRLCENKGIQNPARHRAMGDTEATFELFRMLMAEDDRGIIETALKHGSQESFLPNHVKTESFLNLPELPGVYYFTDKKGKILYIGKARNIKKRVRSHFSGNMKSARKQAFIQDIHDISYRLTGTELIALLLEDAEIRKHWPRLNRAQKARSVAFGIYAFTDQAGFLRLGIQKHTGSGKPLRVFHSLFKARQWLYQLAESREIHPAYFSLPSFQEMTTPDQEAHNDKLHSLLLELSKSFGSLIIKGEGRRLDEQSFVWIHDGRLMGFGFIPYDKGIHSTNELEDHLEKLPSSETTEGILRSYLEKNYLGNVIPLKPDNAI